MCRAVPCRAVVGLDGAPAALSRAPFGDFYRPLAPGGYGVLVTAEGYSPFSANITVPEVSDARACCCCCG